MSNSHGAELPHLVAYMCSKGAPCATINSSTQVPGTSGDLQDSTSAPMAYFPFWLVRAFAELAVKSVKYCSWAPYQICASDGSDLENRPIAVLRMCCVKNDPFHQYHGWLFIKEDMRLANFRTINKLGKKTWVGVKKKEGIKQKWENINN